MPILRDTKEEWRQDIAMADQWKQRPLEAQVGQISLLVGMPQYGVALSGSVDDPVIENHSGRVIIGYDVRTADSSGRLVAILGQTLAPSVLPAGLPDGKSLYVMGNAPVDPGFQRAGRVRLGVPPGRGPAVRATLTSLIFGDGQFVGLDESGVFERFGNQIKAVSEVGILAKTGAWDKVEALAPPQGQPPRGGDTFGQLAASRLVETRRLKGAAAAGQLAEIYSSLPTLWK